VTDRPLISYIRVSTSQQGRSGLGIEAQRQVLKAKRILKEWQRNEVLETFNYDDPISRKERSGTRSVLGNRPDRKPS
jgi:hypothetical protein